MTQSRKRRDVEVIADRAEEELDVSDLVTQLETEADEEIAAGTVTLRWGREQIAVIKRAAAILGIPYQTYLKQVVFRQAVADIEQADAVLKPARRTVPGSSRSRSQGGRAVSR